MWEESLIGDAEGVSFMCCCCRLFCFLLAYLNWFEGLEFLALSFLVGWLVTKTYWEAARTLSSSIKYLSTRLNRLSIVVGDFSMRDLKNGVLGLMLHLKICRMTSILQDSTWSTTWTNCFMKFLSDSFSCNLMFCRVLMFYFWRAKHK